MVLIPLVRDYIDRMLHDVSGMKVLILDRQTVRTSPPQTLTLVASAPLREIRSYLT
jgi:hypothetical protein